MSKKKKTQLNEFFALGGIASPQAINNISAYSSKINSPKLKNMVEEIYGQQEENIDVSGFLKEVGQYNSFGKLIYREGNLQELAERLSKLAETAKIHAVNETDDWVDKISVNRNMKSLTGYAKDFNKIASEANQLQHRMEDLYENMGFILGKYYEIKEDCPNKSTTNKITKRELKEKDESYKKFFMAALDKYGVNSPAKLNDDDKKDFYNYIDRNWSANKEND